MSKANGERRTNSSCEFVPQETDISGVHYYLLLTTVILAILNVIVIIVVIVGYCKFVAGREKGPVGNNFSRNIRMDLGETASESHSRTGKATDGDEPGPLPKIVTAPVKMRKRSMTFTETDEECRRYRENSVDLYAATAMTTTTETENSESPPEDDKRFRKKSVVTFVGVE